MKLVVVILAGASGKFDELPANALASALLDLAALNEFLGSTPEAATPPGKLGPNTSFVVGLVVPGGNVVLVNC